MDARTFGLLVLLAAPGPGLLAADASGSFAVKGVGLTRCSDAVAAFKEVEKEKAALYIGWVSGFITATNQNLPETFDITPWQNTRTLLAALISFCDKNADMRFGEATARLAGSLGKDRLVSRSDLVPIEHEGQRHFVYKEALRRAQAALAALGMYRGDVSGEFDASTRSALEAFQAEQKLPVNGLPDQQTLYALFRQAEG